MPSFQHSVLPFRCCRFAVLLCRAVVPMPFFRSVAAIAVARENGIAGNVFPLPFCHCMIRTLIGCPPSGAYGRTAKIDGTAVTAQRQVGTATAQRNGGNQQHNSYGAYGILTEFV